MTAGHLHPTPEDTGMTVISAKALKSSRYDLKPRLVNSQPWDPGSATLLTEHVPTANRAITVPLYQSAGVLNEIICPVQNLEENKA